MNFANAKRCHKYFTENDMTESYASSRSKTMPTLGRPKMVQPKVVALNDGDRLRNAKDLVEKAIKVN